MDGRGLLLETSEVARAGLALDGRVVASVELPKGREHNRALVPKVSGLLDVQGWKVAELTGIAVGIGPGSYTGLRIGVMLAKTLAYSTGCRLIAVPTLSITRCPLPDGNPSHWTTSGSLLGCKADSSAAPVSESWVTTTFSGGWGRTK